MASLHIKNATLFAAVDETVILDGCVGCGVCEMICPVEPTVIVIDSSESRGMSV